jgi:hypothetical protein
MLPLILTVPFFLKSCLTNIKLKAIQLSYVKQYNKDRAREMPFIITVQRSVMLKSGHVEIAEGNSFLQTCLTLTPSIIIQM